MNSRFYCAQHSATFDPAQGCPQCQAGASNQAQPIDAWREAQDHHQAGCAFLTKGGPKCPKCLRQDTEARHEAVKLKLEEQAREAHTRLEKRQAKEREREAAARKLADAETEEFERLARTITKGGLNFCMGMMLEKFNGPGATTKENARLRRQVLEMLRACKNHHLEGIRAGRSATADYFTSP